MKSNFASTMLNELAKTIVPYASQEACDAALLILTGTVALCAILVVCKLLFF